MEPLRYLRESSVSHSSGSQPHGLQPWTCRVPRDCHSARSRCQVASAVSGARKTSLYIFILSQVHQSAILGVVYESAVTVADVSNSGVVAGGRFFGGMWEKTM